MLWVVQRWDHKQSGTLLSVFHRSPQNSSIPVHIYGWHDLHTDRPVAWGEKKDKVVYHLHQVAGEPVVLLPKGGCVQWEAQRPQNWPLEHTGQLQGSIVVSVSLSRMPGCSVIEQLLDRIAFIYSLSCFFLLYYNIGLIFWQWKVTLRRGRNPWTAQGYAYLCCVCEHGTVLYDCT